MFSAGVAARYRAKQSYVCDLSVVIGPYRYSKSHPTVVPTG